MRTWTHEHTNTWAHESMKAWTREHMKTWTHENMKTWKYDKYENITNMINNKNTLIMISSGKLRLHYTYALLIINSDFGDLNIY